MSAHKNARTTPYVRELMASRRSEGWSVGEIAEAAGVSIRTVYKWSARESSENRSSRARRVANRLLEPMIAEIARLRRQRMTGAAIARRLKLARSTVAGWLKRLGMGRLKLLEPKPPIVRYERARAGELIHIDTKKLGRFKAVGHRIGGYREGQTRSRGAASALTLIRSIANAPSRGRTIVATSELAGAPGSTNGPFCAACLGVQIASSTSASGDPSTKTPIEAWRIHSPKAPPQTRVHFKCCNLRQRAKLGCAPWPIISVIKIT